MESSPASERRQARRRGPPALRALQAALFAAFRFALRRRFVVLIASGLVACGLATQVPAVRVVLSISELAEPALASTEANRRLRAEFDRAHVAFLLVAPATQGETLSPAALERLAAFLERERRENPDLARVLSPFELERLRPIGGQVWKTPLLRTRSPEALDALLRSPWNRVLTDSAGRDVGAELTFRDSRAPTRFGRFDPQPVGALLERAERELSPLGARTFLTGEAPFEYWSLRGIRRFRILNLALVAAILIGFRLLFGTWRSGGLLVGVLGIAGFVVYGSMSLAGSPIDYLSVGLFLMLAVAALEDYLFLTMAQANGEGSWRAACRRLLLPSLFTSLTTVLGFASLAASDLAIVRRFGLWAAFGAATEWVVTFLVLPALLVATRARPTWTDAQGAWPARHAAQRVVRLALPRGVARALLLALPLAVLAAFHVGDVADDVTRLFDTSHPYRQSLDYLSNSRGWVGEVSLVFPPRTPPDTVAAVLAEVARDENVAVTIDPYDVVRYMSGGLTRPGAFPTLLAADGQVRASVYLERVRLDVLRRSLDSMERACRGAGCRPAGDLVSYADFAGAVPTTLLRSFGTCLVVVGGLIFAILRWLRVRSPAFVLGASLWGPAVMLVALWVLRVPISFLTCVFASALVGLTGDNAIQYAFATRGGRIESGIAVRGGASALVAGVMGLACLCFLGSAFVPSRVLGALLAAGLGLSLAGDLWLLKGLLKGAR